MCYATDNTYLHGLATRPYTKNTELLSVLTILRGKWLQQHYHSSSSSDCSTASSDSEASGR